MATKSNIDRRLLAGIIESPTDLVIFALDRAYRYIAFNSAHRRTMSSIWGVEIAEGVCMLDVIGRDDDRERARHNFDRALGGESFTLIEAYGDTARGRREYENAYSPIVGEAGEVVGLTVFLRDVTEARRNARELTRYRQDLELLVSTRARELEDAKEALRREMEERLRVEAQMQRSQKLESLGVLSGGIAHDFNNILLGIMGNAELALEAPRLPESAAGHLAEIRAIAERAAELTGQMLAFSGQGPNRFQTIELNDLLRDMRPLLTLSVSSAIHLEFDPCEREAWTRGDASRLRQVAMNLTSNAAEACGKHVGTVRIRTSIASLPRPGVHLAWDVEPGQFVCLEVADNGCGMEPETLDRIFDPFYSTRVTGRGLGLSAVQGIIRSHNGTYQIQSSPGEGTCFRVFLPLRSRPAIAPTPDRPLAAPAGSALGTVIVADDDARCLNIVASMLEREGFTVLRASDGHTCLQHFRTAGESTALVCLDLSMPGMDGVRTLEHLRALDPVLPAVVMSGFSEAEVLDRLSHLENVECLKKPFRAEELARVVRATIRMRQR